MVAADKKSANKIATLAAKKLREQYRDEYEAFKEQAAAELGVPYTRRKTQEEKDREALTALLSNNPVLRSELVNEIAAQIKSEEGTPATPSE